MATRFFPNYYQLKVTSPFGMRTLGGVTRMHNGIDLVAMDAQGRSHTDSITAHTAGTVSAVGYDDSRGNYIQIRAGSAEMVYYHLKEKSPLQKGEKVARGQVLGFMGATGNCTGAHLHFGIREGDKWIDPAPFLEKDYGPVEEHTNNIPIKTLQYGARGETVRSLQILLTGRGCNGNMHAPDGIFGPNTLGAVKLYQEKAGLEPDGIVGVLTWKGLMGVL